MKYNVNHRIIAMVAVLVIPAAWSCSKSDNPSAPVATTSIQLKSNTSFGNILTDSAGRTLYFFSIDANGNSGCTGGCTTAWPVFYKASPTLSAGLNAADFGTITRPDGAPQTTYKGWPLYYYQNDTQAGDVKGDAVNNSWFVAKPDYTVMLVNAQLVGNDGVQYTSHYTPGQEITQYITDDYGRTLYAFTPDKFKKNNFTKPDFSNNAVWPIDTLTAIKSIPSILDKSQFDTIQVYGKVQLTYKGWPLYYFGNDHGQRGSNKGVSVPSPGVWPVVNNNTTTAPNP
jgi:predicted lipoprotein with Yx(FWY)xxD motif